MKHAAIAAALAVALAGCGPLTTVGLVVGGAVTAYCAGTTDAAKHLVRDTVTAGRQVIACGETAPAPVAPAVAAAGE